MSWFDWLLSPFRKSSGLERLLLSAFGSPTSSGISVNADTALQAAAVYACVAVLSESVAQLPLPLYKRVGKGKEKAAEHPLYSILHDMPNRWQTAFEFRQMLMSHALLRGKGMAFINRVGKGKDRRVFELIPIHPDTATIKKDPAGGLDFTVSVTSKNGTADFRSDELLVVRGMTLDGVNGITPITYAREAIGLSIAAEKHGARLFGNGARPGGVLSTPGSLKDEEVKSLRERWQEAYSGENSFKVAVLHGGLDFKPIGMSNEDAQYLETRKYQRSEIASLFRVPAHLINDLEKATFSNVEHLGLSFVVHSLQPWLVRWEQAIFRDLLTPAERGQYFAEHTVAGLLRGDVKSRYEAYGRGILDGWMTRNEARILENLNPIDGLDEPLQPLNMTRVGSDGKPVDGNTPEGSNADQTA